MIYLYYLRAKHSSTFYPMSTAKSKKVYRLCFFVLLVLFVITAIAQLILFLGSSYLPMEQAALSLKVVLISSIVIDIVCVVVGCVAMAYVSSLATVLWALGAFLLLALLILLCILFILSGARGGCGGGWGCGYCSGGSTGEGERNSDSDPNCLCLSILALAVVYISLLSAGVAIYCLFWHCQWTMVHEHEHDNTPFLIALFVSSTLRALLMAAAIATSFTIGNDDDEEERKKLLEKSSPGNSEEDKKKPLGESSSENSEKDRKILGDASLTIFPQSI
jgi:hypothetical protein